MDARAQHGGLRERAGRKASPDSMVVTLRVRMPAAEYSLLQAAAPNVSGFVRALIRKAVSK